MHLIILYKRLPSLHLIQPFLHPLATPIRLLPQIRLPCEWQQQMPIQLRRLHILSGRGPTYQHFQIGSLHAQLADKY
jgi:hypothetical protein